VGRKTWPGRVVGGGTATVTVVKCGVTYNLSKPITVAPRPWAWSLLPPTLVSNGTIITLPPPIPNSDLGAARILNYFHSSSEQKIVDNGPNHEFIYVAVFSDTDPIQGRRVFQYPDAH
jgi:hypothetical protein